MPDPITRTEADSVAEIARKGIEPISQGPDDYVIPSIVFPQTGKVESLEHLLARPVYKRGTFKAQTSDAFIGYVLLHRTPGTLVTGTVTTSGGTFHCDLDGHEPNQALDADQIREGLPSWRTHHAHLALEASPEWTRWNARNTTIIEQSAFAEFIEENAADITVPEGSKLPDAAIMLSVATTLDAKTEVTFSSGIRLQNGTQQLTYNELVQGQAVGAEGKIEIPARFAVAIAPFVGAPKYAVIARLKYYLSRGKVSFKYELDRPYRIIEDAYKAEALKIAQALGQPVLLGSFN
jgi:uncharacterized protein YfdQ (DUF2303 family)